MASLISSFSHPQQITNIAILETRGIIKKNESKMKLSFEPQHEISNNVVCATSKASDQPAYTCSLIRAFASRLNILGLLSY